eukprot:TRINITY_DN4935_c0_g2_i1.p1 TRINITY_DN4935_c0_g2~~TRINITY_DN4935_c0_g2_i1.p1  ORF type:complete len:614 (+),score=85.79 TRINITY_DN4935_c0_g2_i1:75-1844(+)
MAWARFKLTDFVVSTPDESPVDRTRRLVLVPTTVLPGLLALGWFLGEALSPTPTHTKAEEAGLLIVRVTMIIVATVLPAVSACASRARKVTRWMCEATAVLGAATVVSGDLGFAFLGAPSVVSLNVVVLDILLLCDCSDFPAKVVLVVTVACIFGRVGLELENFGDVPCWKPARFSFYYFRQVGFNVWFRLLVLLVDYALTRGFAKSMREQKNMVYASIEVSEVAAVMLSRYQTDDAKLLMESAGAERMPEGLRAALLQLVENLAMYRPYLPQSCRSRGPDSEGDDTSDGDASLAALAAPTAQRQRSASLDTDSPADPKLAGLAVEVKNRRVSMVAVNSRSFLRAAHDSFTVSARLRSEVDAFVGEVAAERGVLDLVSGDHMFANFNASRICPTHRVSAARVAWGMFKTRRGSSSAAWDHHGHTACACSGQVLCGDFGTSDALRFMIIGGVFNTVQCLERVAAQQDAVLVDNTIRADIGFEFYTLLVERVSFTKRCPQPFMLWRLTSKVSPGDELTEWMYAIATQPPNPHEDWNEKFEKWLKFGPPLHGSDIEMQVADLVVTAERRQSYLVEATVVGETVALHSSPPQL